MLARVESERQRGAEGKCRILSPVIIQRGIAHLDGAVRHRVEHLQRGDDFAGGERLNLESVIGDLGDSLAEILATAVERVERLRPTGRQPPLHLGHGLCDRGRSDRAGGEADAPYFQEITTFHAASSGCWSIPRRGSAILRSLFVSPTADAKMVPENSNFESSHRVDVRNLKSWPTGRMANRCRQIKRLATGSLTQRGSGVATRQADGIGRHLLIKWARNGYGARRWLTRRWLSQAPRGWSGTPPCGILGYPAAARWWRCRAESRANCTARVTSRPT